MGINMVDLMKYHYTKGYCLHLSDRNNWWITGDENSIGYVDKFAAIMRLDECLSDGMPKLIFSKIMRDQISDSSEYSSSIIETGWKFHEYNSARIWSHVNFLDVLCEFIEDKFHDEEGNEKNSYLAMWASLKPVYLRSMRMGGLPFHAALVECAGRGILLAAKGGGGKTTCCRRLPDYWKILCDDENLVVLDKNNVYQAHPFPTWSDYSMKRSENTWDVQYSVPFSGIFFIEQSESDEVIPLSVGQTSVQMTRSVTQVLGRLWNNLPREEQKITMRDIFNNAFEMAKIVPAFRLCVSLDGRFWEEIEKVLGAVS
jgi:SynChlorMet cassette protein ScmC